MTKGRKVRKKWSLGIRKQCKRGRGGKRRQLFRQVLAECLCVVLLAVSMPLPVSARVETVELEELAIPTEYPAKGVLHLQLVTGRAAGDSDVYIYQENYLPVLVDANHMVYAKLETLADFLGIRVYISEPWATAVCFNTKIYLALNDSMAGYENDFFSAFVNMGAASVSCEDDWYVPLEAFLKLADAEIYYAGENWLGKEELYLVPPQRTALDDIQDFYKYAYVDYAFEYVSDMGMTMEQMKKMMGWSEIGLGTKGLGSLDWDAVKATLLCWWGDNVKSIEYSQVDTFMGYMLSAEENIISKMIENASSAVNGAGVFMDIAEKVGGTEKVKSVLQSVAGKDSAGKLTKWKQYFKMGQAVDMGMKHILSLASTCDNLLRVDQKELEAAKDFYERSEGQSAMIAGHRERMKRNIDERENALARVPGKWISEEWLRLLVDVGSLAEVSTLGAVGFFSSCWDGVTGVVNIITGKQLDKMEAFIQGVFGTQYEMDAIEAARADIDTMLIEGRAGMLTDADKEKLRRMVSHALKACYVTRSVGCQACSSILEDKPGLKALHERLNETIADMMARLNMEDDVVAFGKVKEDLKCIHVQEYDHFPNVIFNICQISGQVLSWEDEKPLKGVRIEVVGDDGSTIHEFKTDAGGEFDEAFVLNDVDPYAVTPLQKELTLHLYYKRNPVILEYIQVQCFHSYLIEGLHAGKKTEEVIAYVNGARDEGGRTVLDITRIELADDTISFGVPDWQDGVFDAFAAMPDQIRVESDTESVVLDEGVKVQTIYSQMAPDGSLMNGLVGLLGTTGDDSVSSLFQTKMHTAKEIQDFIDIYTKANGETPVFRIRKSNSLVDSMEQVVVITAD